MIFSFALITFTSEHILVEIVTFSATSFFFTPGCSSKYFKISNFSLYLLVLNFRFSIFYPSTPVDIGIRRQHVSFCIFLSAPLTSQSKSDLHDAIIDTNAPTYANIRLIKSDLRIEKYRICSKRTGTAQIYPTCKKSNLCDSDLCESDLCESDLCEFDCITIHFYVVLCTIRFLILLFLLVWYDSVPMGCWGACDHNSVLSLNPKNTDLRLIADEWYLQSYTLCFSHIRLLFYIPNLYYTRSSFIFFYSP